MQPNWVVGVIGLEPMTLCL